MVSELPAVEIDLSPVRTGRRYNRANPAKKGEQTVF
jgi:hypothetical protein